MPPPVKPKSSPHVNTDTSFVTSSNKHVDIVVNPSSPVSVCDTALAQHTGDINPTQDDGEPVPTQSARFEDQEGDETPRYRGFTDPNAQSRSFKLLQNAMESGGGN